MNRLLVWMTMALGVAMACKTAVPEAQGTEAQVAGAAPAASDKQEKQFTIQVETAPVKAGDKGESRVVIKAGKGYHWNENFPASFKVASESGDVQVQQKEFDQSAFQAKKGEDKATLTVPFQASGKGSVEAVVNFSVCNDEACLVYRNEKVTWEVAVR